MAEIITSFSQLEHSEGPREITKNNVIYWSKEWQELKGEGFAKKAHLFILYDCIKYLGDSQFICLPLNTQNTWQESSRIFPKKPWKHDYNFSAYKITQDNGRWSCECQGWHTKEKKGEGRADGCQCSHVLGLFLGFKAKIF